MLFLLMITLNISMIPSMKKQGIDRKGINFLLIYPSREYVFEQVKHGYYDNKIKVNNKFNCAIHLCFKIYWLDADEV